MVRQWVARPSAIPSWTRRPVLAASIPTQDETQVGVITSIPVPDVDTNMTSTVGTEDDTFRILARPDIDKMVILHQECILEHRDASGTYDQQKNIVFSKYYGWTWIEFLKAKKEAGYIL